MMRSWNNKAMMKSRTKLENNTNTTDHIEYNTIQAESQKGSSLQ